MTRTFKVFAILAAAAAAFAFAPTTRAADTGTPGSMSVGLGPGTNFTGNPSTAGIGSTANATASGRIGIGSNRRPAPAYISTYSAPSYSGGNYVTLNGAAAVSSYRVPNMFPTNSNGLTSTSNFLGGSPGFVPPPIIMQPSFTPLNYTGLPGDFFARSNYYVPRGVSPIVVYPSPTAIGNTIGMGPSVGARSLGSGGLLNSPGGGVHNQLSHGVIQNR